MAENNTATATSEDVAAVEAVNPQATEATAEATAPVAPAPAPAPAQPRNDRGPSDLTPDLKETPDDSPRKEVANGRAYEIAFIVRANNPAALEGTQERVRALVEGVDGAIDNVRVSEIRRLSYPIEKQTEGVYVVINARFEKSLTEELDRFFKLEETVLRHLVLRQD